MLEESKFYQPSGKFSPMAPILMVLIGGLGAALIAAIYAVAIFYIPFIYINFFLTLGLGFGVGVLVALAGKIGKSRSTLLNLLFGFVIGVFAFYVQWVVWIYALSEWQTLVLKPGQLWLLIKTLNLVGIWNIFGATPSGFFLWLIWGIEALIIIGLPTLIGATSTGDVFCERCGEWAKETELQTRKIPENLVEVLNELSDGKIAGYCALPPAEAGGDTFLTGVHASCPRCEQLHTLSVSTVTLSHDDKGEEEKEENEAISKLLVSAEDAQSLS